MDNFQVYLDRIAILNTNFENCETGKYFLIKTQPIWDSITQCIHRKSSILKEMATDSDDLMSESYKKELQQYKNAKIVNSSRDDIHSFLKNLLTGISSQKSNGNNNYLQHENIFHVLFSKLHRLFLILLI